MKHFPFFFIILLFSCKSRQSMIVWDKNFPGIGSQSSPRVADLNQDGVDDIIVGACKNEYQPTDQGVMALDGKTGEILWECASNDQVFGSATLLDIDGDRVKDVIIGGRWAFLKAISGKTGKPIWSYQYKDSIDPILKFAKYNFYNSVIVPDQNNDGTEDIVIQNGGNHRAAPNDSIHRYPGLLMLIDSKSGNILAADTMPDGRECYMSPIYFKQPDHREYIAYGSGGETFGGHLYLTMLEDLKNKRLNKSITLVTDTLSHGFIAPPVVVDINGDGYGDIVSISHSSSITAVDGKSFKPIWSLRIPNTESSNGFAVGQFTNDQIPDFFTFVSKGIWPESKGTIEILIDGHEGKIIYQDSIGCTGFSSPVAYDFTADGVDDVMLSINEYDCNRGFTSDKKLEIQNRYIVIDLAHHRVQDIETLPNFKNIYSTPWIGDLDHDGYLDMVYSQFYSPGFDLLAFMGWRIKRVSTGIKIKNPVKWGGYMGSHGDGIY